MLLGVGTVMDDTVSLLPRLKALGATFALSPIDPVGFVGECQRLGLLAIPSAFTSNECWALHRRGVRLIKLFHAGLASPAILKSMLAVTPLGEHLNILPSGGVCPTTRRVVAAGAAVSMGPNLVGNLKDLPDGGGGCRRVRRRRGSSRRRRAAVDHLGGAHPGSARRRGAEKPSKAGARHALTAAPTYAEATISAERWASRSAS